MNCKRLLEIICALLFVLLIMGFGYLVMVVIVWLCQMMLGLAFGKTLDYNIWPLGLIAYIIWLIFTKR